MRLHQGRRDVALLAAGQAISVAGDAAAFVALLLRLRPDGSGWVAALLAAELIPFVVAAPVSGRLVDRVETHRALLTALVGQALVAVPLALVAAPWATVALFAALSALATVVRPATAALLPVIVGADEATTGYARLATGMGIGWIVGPALGGLLTGAVGPTSTLLVDAGTFALLAVAVAFVRARRPPSAAPARAAAAGAWDGFRLLWRSPVLRIALLVSAVATGCAVVDNVAAPFRFIDQLGTSAFGYGVYLTVWSTGALIGVQLLPHLPPRRHAAALAAGNLLTGLGIVGIGVAPGLAVAFASSLIGGFGNGLVNVAQSTLIAAHTPNEQHGRAFAAAGAVMQAAIGVGTAAAAPLVTSFGAGRAMAGAGALAALAAAVGFRRLATATRSTAMPSAGRSEGEVGIVEAGGHHTGNQAGSV